MAKNINSSLIEDYYLDKTIQFCSMQHVMDLQKYFKMPMNRVLDIASSDIYREFKIKKKNGGLRTIEAPALGLKVLQHKMVRHFNVYYFAIKPACSYGFVLNLKDYPYNIITNAQQHLGKKQVLNIDLKDFFHSISSKRVYLLFIEHMKMSTEVATLLTALCCHNNHLPMGAATSPVLSNLICLALDEKLMDLAKSKQLVYTRYADDLTFSGEHIDDALKQQIIELINEEGFEINEKKMRLQTNKGRQVVTGIKVNEKINVDRRYVRRIRAILNNIKTVGFSVTAAIFCAKKGYSKPKKIEYMLNSLAGMIEFVGSVKGKKDAVYLKLLMNYNNLVQSQS
jgi:RNA-directed DNA polymerase